MEKAAILVPGEKQEPLGSYSIGFEYSTGGKRNSDNLYFQHASGRLLSLLNGIVIRTSNICRREMFLLALLADKLFKQGRRYGSTPSACVVALMTFLKSTRYKAEAELITYIYTYICDGTLHELQIFTTIILRERSASNGIAF